MLKESGMSELNKAINNLYDMNNNERLKELARMREKAMHDKASELEEAIQTGRAEGRAERDNEILAKMKAFGLSDNDISRIFSINS